MFGMEALAGHCRADCVPCEGDAAMLLAGTRDSDVATSSP